MCVGLVYIGTDLPVQVTEHEVQNKALSFPECSSY